MPQGSQTKYGSRSYQFVFPICFRTKDMEEMAFFDHPNVNVPALKPPKHVLHRPPNTKRLKKTRIPVDHDGSDSAPWRFLVLNFLEAGLL